MHHDSHFSPEPTALDRVLQMAMEQPRYDGAFELDAFHFYALQAGIIPDSLFLPKDMQAGQSRSMMPTPAVQSVTTMPGLLAYQQMHAEMPAAPARKWYQHKSLEAMLIGPLEVAVGVVGVVTSGLAVLALIAQDNPALAIQNRLVFTECSKMIAKGIGHTLTAPIRAVQAAFA